METSKHIQEPLDRIATGWRISFNGERYRISHRIWGGWTEHTASDEARSYYLRLTESDVRKAREGKGEA